MLDYETTLEQLHQRDQLIDFANNVDKMRWYQKEYIKTRDHYDLLDAKRMEKTVDGLLEQLKNLGVISCIFVTFLLSSTLW
jgi:hypothetical protein